MLLKGDIEFNGVKCRAVYWQENDVVELALLTDGTIRSSYRATKDAEFMFGSNHAREIYRVIRQGVNGIKATKKKDILAVTLPGKGVQQVYPFKKAGIEFTVYNFLKELSGITAYGEDLLIELDYEGDTNIIPTDKIDYALVRVIKDFEFDEETGEVKPQVRSLKEISFEKDVTWLKNKKYYIIDNPVTAERLFSHIEKMVTKGKLTKNFKPLSYDTETTGLKINQFGKYGSKYREDLRIYNEAVIARNKELEENGRPKEELENTIRVDRLVGIILCWEPDVSYYFPCGHRYLQNLYEKEQYDSIQTKNIIQSLKVWASKHQDKDMAKHIRDTIAKNERFTSDVLLMQRCRTILEDGFIVAHNGSFEWKVGYLFDIVTNLKGDTMILHQILHKFRNTTSNRGEASNLKYLALKEFGIDQLELKDFFIDFKEDEDTKVKSKKKKKKKGLNIDFSYMDYEGTLAYAPADGDITLQLYHRYMKDLREKHPEMTTIYEIEVIVSGAIGYMEFSGHRIDEKKIEETKLKLIKQCDELERKIRSLGGLNPDKEAEGAEVLNLGSPAQLVDFFYNRMKIPFNGDKPSVAKSTLKGYLKAKNEDGSNKYPVIHLYTEWKKNNTLLTKFFDALQDFMYPGGFIFSKFGQISTATGRMSCSSPNAQQYPKIVSDIVIPRDNCIFNDSDFSQIEYRVLVAMANEKYFLEMFSNPDNDYHTLQASNMYGVDYAAVTKSMRSDAKSFNFGIPYGMGFGSLAILLYGQNTDHTRELAKEKYEMYFKDQPNVRQFFDDVKEMATVNKYTKTYFNRRRYYSFTDKDGKVSNKHKAAALRQAGNAVIQGSAADIFKIAVARLYLLAKRYDLFGKFYFTNMVHDEVLMEIDVTKLNARAMLREILNCMQFKIEGFPPLFVGAGFGMSWNKAKGGSAEIHPHLGQQISEEVKNLSIFKVEQTDPIEVKKVFDDYNFNFRSNKIKDYLLNPESKGKLIHPVIGSLLNTFFDYGLPSAKEGEEEDRLKKCLRLFIEDFELPVHIDDYKISAHEEEVEEEEEYSDGEEEDFELEEYFTQTDFALIDEEDKLSGVNLVDLIDTFGLIVSDELKVVGVDTRNLTYGKLDRLGDYLNSKKVDSDEDAYQVVLLGVNNRLNYLPFYVKDINGSELSTRIKLKFKGTRAI